MVKKSLLSIAIAASVAALAGCNVSTTDRYDNKVNTSTPSVTMPKATAKTYPAFDPANSELPLANDIVFANAERTDGTAYSDVMPSKASPVTTALQQLAGFSTVAPLYIEFVSEEGKLSATTTIPAGTVWLMDLSDPDAPAPVFLDSSDPTQGFGYEARFVEYNKQAAKPNAKKYALQILPKKPLDPATQYMVILTNGIVDADGKPIGQSSMHNLLSDTSKGIIYPSGALIGAATAVQTWNAGAAKIVAGLNQQFVGPMAAFAPQGDPVFAYTFRTDNGLAQLRSYAAPALFNAKIAGAMQDPEAAKLIMGGLEAPRARNVALIPAVNVDVAIKQGAIQGVADQLEANAGLTQLNPGKSAEDIVMDGEMIVSPGGDKLSIPGRDGASPATLLDTADTHTRFIQGQIELPNFLPAAEASPLADKLWTANDALAGLGITPPKDMDSSTNVTYHFPFPKSVGVNTAPLLITMPDKVDYSAGGANPAGQNCSGLAEFSVVIYVHGITGSRGNMLPYASALAANCIATVGIDLPLHGVAPKAQDGSANSLLALNVEPSKAALTGSPWGAVAGAPALNGAFNKLAERHNNTYQLPTQARTDIVFGAEAKGDSGSAFINLQNFGRTRDNLRQGVTDLLNLNASLGNISDALEKQGKAKLDLDNVFVAGHSLGGIVASAFVAANNAAVAANANPQLNKVEGLIIANSGGHITKMLENSPAFAPQIVGGLAQIGVMQGTEDFEKFLYIFQSIVDGIDPANTASQLGSIPVQLFTADGGLGGGTMTKSPDTTVPVYDYFAVETGKPNPFENAIKAGVINLPSHDVPTAKSYLAGAQAFRVAGDIGTSATFKETTYTVANHATFADAGSSVVGEDGNPTADTATANANFIDMVTKSVTLINGGGATAETN